MATENARKKAQRNAAAAELKAAAKKAAPKAAAKRAKQGATADQVAALGRKQRARVEPKVPEAAQKALPQTVGDLHERAVLVRCVEHTWMGGTIDKSASKELTDSKGATADAGHFWKRLVPKAAIRPIANAGNAVKHFHRANTLPWLDGDMRMLPAAELENYMRGVRKLIAERTKAEEAFYSQYPHWMEQAEKTHGALFDAEHYPSLEELRKRFGFEIDVLPIPNVQDWRINLADDQVAEMRKQVSERYVQIQQEAMRELCSRLAEVVEHMQKRLSDPDAKFKNSLVSNVREMLDTIARLNVTNDPALEAMRSEIAEQLATAKPDELREDPVKRKAVADKASSIMARMSAYMGK